MENQLLAYNMVPSSKAYIPEVVFHIIPTGLKCSDLLFPGLYCVIEGT